MLQALSDGRKNIAGTGSNLARTVAEKWQMPNARSARRAHPLDQASLRAAAIRYVERYQTSRARLLRYLVRKLRERGWAGDTAPDPEALADDMVQLGYVDDAAFAASRVRSLAHRGLGARRLQMALSDAGIAEDLRTAALDGHDPLQSALEFARRKRLGPFGTGAASADPRLRQRQLAAFARAGHPHALARRILAAHDPADLQDDD